MTTNTRIVYVWNFNSKWKWGTPSVFRKGTISWTLNSWNSERMAKQSARRKFGKTKLSFVKREYMPL